MRIYKLSFLIVSIFVLISCDANSDFEESFKFSDSSVQKTFVQKLKENDIPYRIDGDGNIWYYYSNRNKVNSLIQLIVKEEYPTTSTFFTDSKYADLFESMLVEKRIEYKKDDRSGDIYFIWDKKDDAVAKELGDKIDSIYKEEMISNFIREREEK